MTFDNWIDDRYGAVERGDEPAGSGWPDSNEALENAQYCLKVWEDPRKYLLGKYSLRGIGYGLLYSPRVFSSTLDASSRKRALNAMKNIFDLVFAPNLGGKLGHLNEIRIDDYLAAACYMWWEETDFQANVIGEEIDKQACLELFRSCLLSPSPGIQESALHGIGHRKYILKLYENELEAMARSFLETRQFARPELERYAEDAIQGAVV